MSLNMESLFNPQNNYENKIMGQDFDDHNIHEISSSWSSSGSINGDQEDEEEEEEGESCVSSSSPNLLSNPLQDMSSLLIQLPIKRGLSKHYNGKSQSFTSLSNVRCLEDLAKKENPFNKKLKTCKSYGGLRLFAYKSSSNKGSNFSRKIDNKNKKNNNNNYKNSFYSSPSP